MKDDKKNDEVTTEDKKAEQPTKIDPKKRQVILETDGNSISFVKLEVAGDIELHAILQRALIAIQNKMDGR